MAKFIDSCPTCFQVKGYTIQLEERDGVYSCPRDPSHRFNKNSDGYFVRV
jgi:hypothetical protein